MIGKDITFKDQYGNIKEGIVIDDSLTDSIKVKYYETTLNMGWMNMVIERSQIVNCNSC
tara:strand:- start:6031 stop:6207 length:177 start_codon:yes stop_codon:yes gene_type:complete